MWHLGPRLLFLRACDHVGNIHGCNLLLLDWRDTFRTEHLGEKIGVCWSRADFTHRIWRSPPANAVRREQITVSNTDRLRCRGRAFTSMGGLAIGPRCEAQCRLRGAENPHCLGLTCIRRPVVTSPELPLDLRHRPASSNPFWSCTEKPSLL